MLAMQQRSQCNNDEKGKANHEEYNPDKPYCTFIPKEQNTKDVKWWDKILPLIIPIVDEAKTTLHSELEMRLGTVHNSFDAGVSESWFLFHLGRMEQSSLWKDNLPKWQQLLDIEYSDHTRYRGQIGSAMSCIRKTVIRHYDIPIAESEYGMRLMLKTETPWNARSGNPTHVRLKQRKSFVYKNMFSYDFTKVWQGKTIEEARHPNNKPIFEIEIECLNVDFATSYIAESLLRKGADLLVAPASTTSSNDNNSNRDSREKVNKPYDSRKRSLERHDRYEDRHQRHCRDSRDYRRDEDRRRDHNRRHRRDEYKSDMSKVDAPNMLPDPVPTMHISQIPIMSPFTFPQEIMPAGIYQCPPNLPIDPLMNSLVYNQNMFQPVGMLPQISAPPQVAGTLPLMSSNGFVAPPLISNLATNINNLYNQLLESGAINRNQLSGPLTRNLLATAGAL